MRRMFSEKQIQELVKNTPKDIESLVDSQGHDRFPKGDIEIEEITGITKTYGKWSLSGTHLMIVLACKCENGAIFVSGNTLAEVDIPTWILDKIIPIFSTQVERKSTSCYGADYTTQTLQVNLVKSSGKLIIQTGSLTLSATRDFRVSFDLIIDND